MRNRRTDLALEARELWQESAEERTQLEGVEAREEMREGIPVTRVSILDRRGEEALGKPVGTYVTLTLDGLARREEDAFGRAARAVAAELGELLGFLHPEAPVLVVGLGNRAITPDAVGPKVHEYTLVTRHLVRQVPEHFGDLRPVASLSAGVLGTTGMESGGTGPGGVGAAAARLRDRGGRAGLPVPKTGVPHGAAGGYRHRPGLWGGQPPGGAGPGFPGGAGDCGGGAHRGGQGPPWPPICWVRRSCLPWGREGLDGHSQGYRQPGGGPVQGDRVRH